MAERVNGLLPWEARRNHADGLIVSSVDCPRCQQAAGKVCVWRGTTKRAEIAHTARYRAFLAAQQPSPLGPYNPLTGENCPRGHPSLRDYFAAQALTGLAGTELHFGTRGTPDSPWPWCAEEAYKAADAMLKARATPPEGAEGTAQG